MACADDSGANEQENSELIWLPETVKDIGKQRLDLYLNFAASACIPGGGCDIEQALDVLYKSRGDITRATQQLLSRPIDSKIDTPDTGVGVGDCSLRASNCSIDSGNSDSSSCNAGETSRESLDVCIKQSQEQCGQQQQEKHSPIWTLNEKQSFEQAFIRNPEDFISVSRELKTKSVKDCVRYYYLHYLREQLGQHFGYQHQHLHQQAQPPPPQQPPLPPSQPHHHQHTTVVSQQHQYQQQPQHQGQLLHYPPQHPQQHIELHQQQFEHQQLIIQQQQQQQQQLLIQQQQHHHHQHQQQQHQILLQQHIQQQQVPIGLFPCKVCGREFEKIKSRSAHMKRHKNERLYG